MNFKRFTRLVTAVFIFTAAFGWIAVCANAGEEYSFKIHNNTNTTIAKILVSQDKKNWGEFDVGSGIKAGETETLVWDQSANSEACKQWVKAVFADKSQSEPSSFDFCEKNLVLEF